MGSAYFQAEELVVWMILKDIDSVNDLPQVTKNNDIFLYNTQVGVFCRNWLPTFSHLKNEHSP
jgi:hypothetical protein